MTGRTDRGRAVGGARKRRSPWAKLLAMLGLRVDDVARAAASEELARRTREDAKRERYGRRGPPIVGG